MNDKVPVRLPVSPTDKDWVIVDSTTTTTTVKPISHPNPTSPNFLSKVAQASSSSTDNQRMSKDLRTNAVVSVGSRSARVIDWPTNGARPAYVSEIYGENVFTLQTMSKYLPKPMFKAFVQAIGGHETMNKEVADAIAHAVRVWAMDRGATHYCHWFQPQTGATAQKHDTFLTLKNVEIHGVEESVALDSFSGSCLLQSEPDASSFPNGGMRTTFEARGYTIWDTTSPMFLRPSAHGASVLFIPSVFISYTGEALDEKTMLLRSNEALSRAGTKLLNLMGDKDVTSVNSTLGCEQEFFLIDRALYAMRPDLKIAGRCLVGSVPPKHQQLDDHYFGAIPSKVTATISEVELELFRLGVPLKTRHNEVAPNQFEVAPIFEASSVAVDHNLLTMETFHTVAHRHGLKALFHEKPFGGVNGSGKHANWSMSTNTGINLLEPTSSPQTNYRFLLFCAATLDAVNKNGGLLRCAIASSSNEHRLGAQEAPPGIVSAFMGEHLDEVLNAVEEGRSISSKDISQLANVQVGATSLKLNVNAIPEVPRDLTDRNRTSPFAFTGNKFEFRAVGSKQSPSLPVTILNAAVAASLTEVYDDLVKQMGSKSEPSTEDILAVVRKYIKQSKNVRFEGNNYSDEWVAEAAKRGLPNLKSAPESFKQLLLPHHVKVLTSQGVFSEAELKSRFAIMNEMYGKNQIIEANTMYAMLNQSILPAAFTYRKELIDGLLSLKGLGLETAGTAEMKVLEKLGPLCAGVQTGVEKLAAFIAKVEAVEDEVTVAEMCGGELVELFAECRKYADQLEAIVADKHWPYPKYQELLF